MPTEKVCQEKDIQWLQIYTKNTFSNINIVWTVQESEQSLTKEHRFRKIWACADRFSTRFFFS